MLFVLVGEICDHPNILHGAEIGTLLASTVFLAFGNDKIVFLAQLPTKGLA